MVYRKIDSLNRSEINELLVWAEEQKDEAAALVPGEKLEPWVIPSRELICSPEISNISSLIIWCQKKLVAFLSPADTSLAVLSSSEAPLRLEDIRSAEVGAFFSTREHRVCRFFTTAVHYVTDVEGHLSPFVDSIKGSDVVMFDEYGQLEFKASANKSYFIFGGDLTDRGTGDIELTEVLLNFKHRYPERVILLVGNRESSKNRYYIELNPLHIRERLLRGESPFWLQSQPHQVPLDYLKKHMVAHGQSPELPEAIEEYVLSLDIEECQLIYLKWMLEQSLGCPNTFSYLAQQLAEREKCAVERISDYDVLRQLIKQTSPNGLMGQYLRQTQVGVVIREAGIIAVHGGLKPENIGRLPEMQPDSPIIDDAEEWIHRFNDWYQFQVEKWANSVLSELPLQLKAAHSSFDCFSVAIPPAYRSIVVGTMLDDERQFTSVAPDVNDYLQRNGLHIVLTGHQPCGDHPAMLRSDDDRVVCVFGDTGYADSQARNAHDSRGITSNTLQIFKHGDRLTTIQLKARMANGACIHTRLNMTEKGVTDNTYVGKLLPNNELVQCQLQEGTYRTIYQQGYTTRYTIRSASEIEALLQQKVPCQAR